jgi:DNA-binding NarL/FixJ family response regulator
VVVLTVSGAENDVIDALEPGAAGYLLKDAPHEEVVTAVTSAASGAAVLSPAITRILIERARRTANAAARIAAGDISEDELAVLNLLAEGKDNAAIAEELFMSLATVKRHVSSLLAKLSATTRVQAAIKAVRAGII